MENINIGKKVEQYRKLNDLSIRELAKTAEITPSMLSQIERGIANPSIQTLKVLAKVLNVPTFSFLLEEVNTEELVVRSKNRRKMVIDHLSYELVSPDISGKLAMAIMKFPPNSTSSEKPLGHKGEEVAFVLTGQIRINLEQEEYILETGDSVKIPSHMKHRWINDYSTEATILFSVTPPSF
ncbi:MAG: helix-turn-helix domain-containing protein [Bacillota bacterium]